MKKIVVLNSGGFDSTTLLAELASTEECEIHSLYFDYGQPNYPYDSKCAKENAEKLGAIHHEICIPKITWTKNTFYNTSINEYKTQYLEMRNVIFISYALSLAEGVGAEAIYMAILANGQYKDTNPEFIVKMGDLCETLGVKFETPYAHVIKSQLFNLAHMLGVGTTLDYISCDTPTTTGEPCGKCYDCKALEPYNELLGRITCDQLYLKSGFNPENAEFRDQFTKEYIGEMRVLLNNSCQLNCEHCYHGNNKLISPMLTDEQLVDSILKAKLIGIHSIHFAGKEPLFDDRIFRIIDGVTDRGVTELEYSLVTNGVNLAKYADRLAESKVSKVFVSVDDEFGHLEDGLRNNTLNSAIKRGILALRSRVPLEIFYDLTPLNISNAIQNIKYWYYSYGVTHFHIRTLRNVGNAEKNSLPQLTAEQLYKLHHELKTLDIDCIYVSLDIGAKYANLIMNDVSDDKKGIINDIDFLISTGTDDVTNNYSLFFEMYCHRYMNQITLTADGYVLGCAMECSEREYNKISTGNILDNDLLELIFKGKQQSLLDNCTQVTKENSKFEKCLFTPIDNFI